MFRHSLEPVELTTGLFTRPMWADCNYCDSGMVVIERDKATLELLPHKIQCLGCGQRYFVSEYNMNQFLTGERPKTIWNILSD